MNPRYDVLVIDLDGTLLSATGRVSDANRRALDLARDAGLTVIVASGRSFAESRAILESLEYDGPVIAAGGCHLCDGATGATFRRETVCPDVVAEVMTALVERNHRALALKDRDEAGHDYLLVGTAELDPASERWFRMLSLDLHHVETPHDDPAPHVTLHVGAVGSIERMMPLVAALRAQLDGRAHLQHWGAVTENDPAGGAHVGTHLLEVFAPHVNKWSMVLAYCEMHGVDPGRVAAIGDGLNDVELIEHAALGVAMGNAFPEVAAVADRTTRDHDDDGVAHAVDQIVRGAW